MTDQLPLTMCRVCRQRDDHPKHQVAIGVGEMPDGSKAYHEHDFDRDGNIYAHFDCPDVWHSAEGVDAAYHARLAALVASGVKGDALRARIVAGAV